MSEKERERTEIEERERVGEEDGDCLREGGIQTV